MTVITRAGAGGYRVIKGIAPMGKKRVKLVI